MSKLKTEGTGGFLLTPAEQTTSLGLGSGVQMHLQGCPLCRLHQWYIQNWLAGGCLVSAIHPHAWVQQHTDLLPLWETFLREGGVQGKEGLAAAELLATDTLPTSWWPQGSAPIPEGWAGLLTTEGGIQTVSPTAQSFGHPQHRDRDSETRGPLG